MENSAERSSGHKNLSAAPRGRLRSCHTAVPECALAKAWSQFPEFAPKEWEYKTQSQEHGAEYQLFTGEKRSCFCS